MTTITSGSITKRAARLQSALAIVAYNSQALHTVRVLDDEYYLTQRRKIMKLLRLCTFE
jgi:hypothetical protein